MPPAATTPHPPRHHPGRLLAATIAAAVGLHLTQRLWQQLPDTITSNTTTLRHTLTGWLGQLVAHHGPPLAWSTLLLAATTLTAWATIRWLAAPARQQPDEPTPLHQVGVGTLAGLLHTPTGAKLRTALLIGVAQQGLIRIVEYTWTEHAPHGPDGCTHSCTEQLAGWQAVPGPTRPTTNQQQQLVDLLTDNDLPSVLHNDHTRQVHRLLLDTTANPTHQLPRHPSDARHAGRIAGLAVLLPTTIAVLSGLMSLTAAAPWLATFGWLAAGNGHQLLVPTRTTDHIRTAARHFKQQLAGQQQRMWLARRSNTPHHPDPNCSSTSMLPLAVLTGRLHQWAAAGTPLQPDGTTGDTTDGQTSVGQPDPTLYDNISSWYLTRRINRADRMQVADALHQLQTALNR